MNKKIKKRALLSTAFLGVLVVMPFLFGCSAQAINGSYNEPAIQKAILTDMVRCYENGSIKKSITLSDFSNFSMLLNDNSTAMGLPNGLTDVKDNQVDCVQLFLSNATEVAGSSSLGGWVQFLTSLGGNGLTGKLAGDAISSALSPGDFDGLFLLSGKGEYMDNIVDPEERAAFLQKLGYMPAESLGDCVYYVYGEKYTGNICYDNGGLKIDNNPAGKRVYSDGKGDNSGLGITFSTDPDGSGTVGQELYVCRNGSCEYVGSAALGWETLKTKTEETLIKNHLTISGYKYEKAVSNTHGNATYILPEISSYPTTRTIGRPIQFFSTNGYTSYASLAYNSNEQLTYLTNGLVNWIFKGIDMDNYLKCDIENPALEPTFTIIGLDLKSGKANPKCGIDKSFAINDSLYGFDSDNYFDPSVILSLDDIIQMIKDLLESGATADIITDDSNSKNACLTSGGAGNLGYIICNVLDMVGSAVTTIYNDAVEPALRVEPTLFSNDNGTYTAWTAFQNIANIAFIIMVLFVIFSQVTGVGIDNYGIKKIMPKLIIAAILINLSYIICQLCVDLSNIVGNSIQELFNSLPTGEMSPNFKAQLGGINMGTEIGVGLLSVLAIGGAGLMLWANPAMVLSLLVGALGVLISILFVFALLAARQAALVVLTVISPLAFACYMLPNTKKLFDKWVKLGEGLLLVYPICGLLIGGGDFVGKLLLSSGIAGESFWTALIAMLAGIIPIFFIPTVLKSSFAAFGKMGATLSGLGDRVRGGATGKVRNSTAYKNAQERSAERNTRIKAGVDKNGNPLDVGKISKLGIALRGGRRNIARSRAQYLKDQDAQNRADRLTTSDVGFKAAQIAQGKAMESEQLKDYMTYINSETNNGENQKALNDLFTQYTTPGQENKFGALAVARIAGRRKDTAGNFLSKHFTNSDNNYSSDMRNALAKEIATGENSGNYRESTPLGFEYASQINSGQSNASNYSSWREEQKTKKDGTSSFSNVHDAIDHHITNSKQLVGLKKSSLDELYSMASSPEPQMDEADIKRLSDIAKEYQVNKGTTGIADATKDEVMEKLANLRPAAGAPQSTKTDFSNGGSSSSGSGGNFTYDSGNGTNFNIN